LLTYCVTACCFFFGASGSNSESPPLRLNLHSSEAAPERITALFAAVDDMNYRALQGTRTRFYTELDGRTDIGTFLFRSNFNDGREDEQPYHDLQIRLVGSKDMSRSCYAVRTIRHAWNETYPNQVESGFRRVLAHWLVCFYGDNIHSVREVDEISYFVDWSDS
ncbi:MAG: hypothetical protein ABR601_04095, partial [Parasphingopyxis sp.]